MGEEDRRKYAIAQRAQQARRLGPQLELARFNSGGGSGAPAASNSNYRYAPVMCGSTMVDTNSSEDIHQE